MTIVVPRSRCIITMPATSRTIGPSGSAMCSQSSSLRPLRVNTDAANATTASFANSDGCTVRGPSAIQRDAPYADTPAAGCSASNRRPIEIASNGPANRRHAAYRMCAVRKKNPIPIAA